MKTLLSIPLVSWENGIWMIGLFALVVIVLVGAVLALVSGLILNSYPWKKIEYLSFFEGIYIKTNKRLPYSVIHRSK